MIFNILHPHKQNKATNKHTTQSQNHKSTNNTLYSDSPPQLAGFAV